MHPARNLYLTIVALSSQGRGRVTASGSMGRSERPVIGLHLSYGTGTFLPRRAIPLPEGPAEQGRCRIEGWRRNDR